MEKGKFIWGHGDLKSVDEDTFNRVAKLYNSTNVKPYKSCCMCLNCCNCDEEDQQIAVNIAQRVYDSFFATNNNDEELLQKVVKSFLALCKKSLQEGELLTKQLFCSSKMRFFDLLIVNGKFSEAQIKKFFN